MLSRSHFAYSEKLFILNDFVAGKPPQGVEQIYTSQSLFTVYVHHTPGNVHNPPSIFTGRVIPNLVDTTKGYAQHVLVKVRTSQIGFAHITERLQAGLVGHRHNRMS